MTFPYIIMTKIPVFMIIMIFCTQLLTNVIPCAIMPSHSIESIKLWRNLWQTTETIGKTFTYKEMKTVYTIILFEQSSAEFKTPDLNGAYLH